LPPTDQSKNDQLLGFIFEFGSWFFYAPLHLPSSGTTTFSALAPLKKYNQQILKNPNQIDT